MDVNVEIQRLLEMITTLQSDNKNISDKIEGITTAINRLEIYIQNIELRTFSKEDKTKMLEKLETIIRTLTCEEGSDVIGGNECK